MATAIRTRFAPSPTGDLHLGGVRTALFNWLLARRSGGAFLLRLDDTDRERSTAAAEVSILEGLAWLGLSWDGEIERQSARAELHRAQAARLEAAGLAYRCWCSMEELAARRKAAEVAGTAPAYDRRCRTGRAEVVGVPPVLRFAMPLDGDTVVDDACRGRITFANATLDDLVIIKADGSPTYNFATVVDDALMGITHIVRGDDLLNSTPKQIVMHRALGFDPPRFAHLPMVLGPGKQRLSKRHGAESVLAYRDRGYLPEALLNAAARLGWSGGGPDREVFTVQEVCKDFALEDLTRSPAVFDAEKLVWLNHEHMGRLSGGELARRIGTYPHSARLVELVDLHRRSARTLVELTAQLAIYFGDRPPLDAALLGAVAPHAALLSEVAARVAALPELRAVALEDAVRALARDRGLKLGPLAQALRVALTGATVSAGVFDVAAALGRDVTLARIADAVRAAK